MKTTCVWPYVFLIIVGGTAAYSSSFGGQFVFDDLNYVVRNPAVHQVWPPYWAKFCPARPLVYLTFAMNFAFGGDDPFGYHVVNLVIHLATALLLFGLVRRTLSLPDALEPLRKHADAVAAVTALWWVVHPLGTQAVTYVYQRLESLAAMLAVASLYAFLRAHSGATTRSRAWSITSILAAYAALLSKEAVFGLPVLVAAYDRLFVAGSWTRVFERRGYYAALFSSWLMVAGLMYASSGDYDKGGIGSVDHLTPLSYALSQSGVLLHYVRLVFVPVGLCIDYGWPTARVWNEYVPQTIVVLAALAITLVGLLRGRRWSFPAFAFFVLLAPTSSIVPIFDLAFEHRMYLPLATILAGVVGGGFLTWVRLRAQLPESRRVGLDRSLLTAVGVVVLACGIGTWIRNFAYADLPTMWRDVVAKAPQNPRGYFMLATDCFNDDDRAAGRRWLEACLRVDPEYASAKYGLVECLVEEGRFDEADELLANMTPARLDRAQHLTAIGLLRAAQHRRDEAERAFRDALAIDDRSSSAYTNLGLLLFEIGRGEEAAALYRRALQCNFNAPSARNNLGIYYAQAGRPTEAAAEFEAGLKLRPRDAKARANYGSVLDRLGRPSEAFAQLQLALEIDPECMGAWISLGNFWARQARYAEAVACFEKARSIDPTDATANQNLAQAQLDLAAAHGNTATPATP